MKRLTKAIAGFLSAAIAVTSMATAAFAETANYNKDGDFATNGAFPETGVILDWGYYARPAGMSNIWATVNYDGHTYANKTSKANPRFHFETNGSTVEGGKYWTDASTIKTGILEVTNHIYVPEIVNEFNEQYVQYFALWGKNDDGTYYGEGGNLYSVIMNDVNDLYIGFTTKDHKEAVSAKESTAEATQPGTAVKVNTAEWYKLTAIINYDANTLDYYLNDEYVCSHENFAANSQYYQMASLYYESIINAESSNATHVYVTGTKMERFKSGSLTATASITSENTVSVKFDGEIKTQITNDTFTVTDVDGNRYTVKSAVLNGSKKAVDITIDGTFKANEAVTVVANSEIESRTASVMAPLTTMVTAPLPADDAFINMNFNGTDFPTDDVSSKTFTDFYIEYPQQTSNNSIASDFADAKAYLDNGDDFYMGYNYRILKAVDDGNGGKALDFHRDGNRTHNLWSQSATKTDQYTYGLVIPFSNGKSVSSGKINIEFDGGKVGTVNADAYTIGLRDKNNPVTVFDKNSAWSNSTALFTFGDYYETATIIYKPQGRSAGYSYYAMDKKNTPSSTGAVLWPVNPDSVQNNNGVRHYKIELDLDTKTYDIYQDSEKIGTSLSLPATTNVAEYDAFVIGCGMDYRNESVSKTFSFQLDNLVVAKPEETPFIMESITNADGSSYTGNVVDNKVVFNFNMDIQSADVTVGTTSVTPTISGKTVTVPIDGAGVGRTTITLSNVTSTDGKTIGEVKAPAVILVPQMSGSFSTTPDGLTLSFDDKGYTGAYTIYVAGYDTNDILTGVEVITEKENDGNYALTKDFSADASVKAFVWGEDLYPLTAPIVK